MRKRPKPERGTVGAVFGVVVHARLRQSSAVLGSRRQSSAARRAQCLRHASYLVFVVADAAGRDLRLMDASEIVDVFRVIAPHARRHQ
jgi:hypothetical protein